MREISFKLIHGLNVDLSNEKENQVYRYKFIPVCICILHTFSMRTLAVNTHSLADTEFRCQYLVDTDTSTVDTENTNTQADTNRHSGYFCLFSC